MQPICECGREKGYREIVRAGKRRIVEAEACDRCLYLDGTDKGESRLIAAMRERGGLCDSYQLASDMQITQRATLRVLRQLRDVGRVERIGVSWEETGLEFTSRALFRLVDRSETYETYESADLSA